MGQLYKGYYGQLFHNRIREELPTIRPVASRAWSLCRMEISRPLDFCSGTTVLANLSYDKRDVVLLFAWIELANVSDNRVN